jgi:crossover junction endodeoxyribonuclease RuvC
LVRGRQCRRLETRRIRIVFSSVDKSNLTLVVGMDPSSSCFGAALLEDKRLVRTDVWKPAARVSAPQRLTDCYLWLSAWLAIYRPEVASIEFLAVARGAQTTRIISHYQAAGAIAAKVQGLVVVEGRVTTARKIVLGDGGADKEAAYEFVRGLYPEHKFLPFGKDGKGGGGDQTDSVVMALAAPALMES